MNVISMDFAEQTTGQTQNWPEGAVEGDSKESLPGAVYENGHPTVRL
ncbi:MAG: hypothetical protein H7Z75_13115 [Ferruginibacter sp.]|nr:hypothetical protein [Cytophagales bacterium]